MAQARRTRKAAAKSSPRRRKGSNLRPAAAYLRKGLGFYFAGLLTGVISILVWQGYQSNQGGLGSGLKAMIEQSKTETALRAAAEPPPEPVLVDNAPRIKPQYDFYTVLPEIEEVLPRDASESPKSAVLKPRAATKPKTSKQPPKKESKGGRKASPDGVYMLQVASYAQPDVAERLKAKLALSGMRASIQKVSIDSKNYYRVRIGPYRDYGTMTADDYKLSNMGFKAMRLRISKAG